MVSGRSIWASHPINVLILGLLIGRLSGLVRELLIVGMVGVGRQSDVLISVILIPDLLADFVMGAGFAAVLVPYFVKSHERALRSALFSAGALIIGISIGVSFALLFFTNAVALFLIPGLIPLSESEHLLFVVALCLLPLVSAYGVLLAFLNSLEDYVWNGLATTLVNLVIIIGLAIGTLTDALFPFFLGALVVAIVGRFILVGLASLKKLKRLPSECSGYFEMLPVPLGAILVASVSISAINLIPVFIRSISSTFGAGYVSVVALCIKFVQLPLILILGSLGLVAIQRLSRAYAVSVVEGDGLFVKNLVSSLFVGIGLAVISALALEFGLLMAFEVLSIQEIYLSAADNFLSSAILGFPVMSITFIFMSDAFARRDYVPAIVAAAAIVWSFYSELVAVERLSQLADLWVASFSFALVVFLARRLSLVRCGRPWIMLGTTGLALLPVLILTLGNLFVGVSG